MITTTTYRSQHSGTGLPMSERVRVSNLRVVLSTGAVSPLAGQKCALMEQAVVRDAFVAGIADATTGAFPGIPAWSPPI